MLNKKSEGTKYILFALFYLIMTISIIIRDLVYYDIYNFIWFCDIGLLLFSIAFFMKDVQLIKGLINIGLIAQFIFILEIVLYYFFNISLSNLPSILFKTGPINIFFSIIIHLFSTNLALYLTYKKPVKKISLLYSAIVILILFSLTLIFTPVNDNINYIFSPNFFFGLEFPFYTYICPILTFILVVLPTNWLQIILYRFSSRKISDS